MKKIFNLIFLTFFIFIGSIVHSFAAQGVATVYEVTMKKIELCTGSTGITDCQNSVTLGSGDKVVDIASVAAGAAAASYGDTALLPLGQVYTHLRVTISRKITIKSESIDTGTSANTDDCMTITTTDTMYDGGDSGTEAARKFTHIPLIAEGGNSGVAEEMALYIIDNNYTYCKNADCSSNTAYTDNELYDCDNPAGSCSYATYQEQHTSDGDDEHMLVYKLTAPYTVTMIPPTLDIGFGTQKAAGAYQVSNNCQFWIEEPIVTITLN